jgi:hypothetical protein
MEFFLVQTVQGVQVVQTSSFILPRVRLCRNALLSALSSRTNVRDLRFLPAVEMTETSTEMRCRIATQSPSGKESMSWAQSNRGASLNERTDFRPR